MRRLNGFFLAGGLLLAGSISPAHAQDVTAGDPAGIGRFGISNSFGRGFKTAQGQGYYTGLYRPFDNTTESVAYSPIFSSMVGAPTAEVATRGWGFAPPWSDGNGKREKTHRLFGRLRHKD